MHLPLSQWKSTGEQVGSTAGEKSAQQVSSGKQTNKQANKVQIREEKVCLLNQHLKASLLARSPKLWPRACWPALTNSFVHGHSGLLFGTT